MTAVTLQDLLPHRRPDQQHLSTLVPVAALYLGIFSNGMLTNANGSFQISGDRSGVLVDPNGLRPNQAVGTVVRVAVQPGPLTMTIIDYSLSTGLAHWQASCPRGSQSGTHLGEVHVLRQRATVAADASISWQEILVGKLMVSVQVLDLNGGTVESLAALPVHNGVTQLLKVGEQDFVTTP